MISSLQHIIIQLALAFKCCAPLIKCITKIDGTKEIILTIYILSFRCISFLENSSNYSETAGSFWFYSKGEATNLDADIDNNNNLKIL